MSDKYRSNFPVSVALDLLIAQFLNFVTAGTDQVTFTDANGNPISITSLGGAAGTGVPASAVVAIANTANDAFAASTAASGLAASAFSDVLSATSAAVMATGTAANAEALATAASSDATGAISTANSASGLADNAIAVANLAKSASEVATGDAASAVNSANSAVSTANSASGTAATAASQAASALSITSGYQSSIDAAVAASNNATGVAQQAEADAQGASGYAGQAYALAQKAENDAQTAISMASSGSSLTLPLTPADGSPVVQYPGGAYITSSLDGAEVYVSSLTSSGSVAAQYIESSGDLTVAGSVTVSGGVDLANNTGITWGGGGKIFSGTEGSTVQITPGSGSGDALIINDSTGTNGWIWDNTLNLTTTKTLTVGESIVSATSLLATGAGSIVTPSIADVGLAAANGSKSNQDKLGLVSYRNVQGGDWTSASWRIQRVVDSSNESWLQLGYGLNGDISGGAVGVGIYTVLQWDGSGNLSGNGRLEFIGQGSSIGTAGSSATALTLVSSGSVATLIIQDLGSNGANLEFQGSGGTTPNKTIRANNGSLEFVNSAYNAVISSMDDNGNWVFGAGLLPEIVKINGIASGTAGGSALYFQQGGTTNNAIGSYSAIIGGAYDNRLLLYGAPGIVNYHDTSFLSTIEVAGAATLNGAVTVNNGFVAIPQYFYSDANAMAGTSSTAINSTGLNTPTNDWATILQVGPFPTGDRAFQLASAWNSDASIHVRTNNGGTSWNAWKTLVDTSGAVFTGTVSIPGPTTSAAIGAVGFQLNVPNISASPVTDTATAANTTVALVSCSSFQQATINAANTGVVYTTAGTLVIGAPPLAGTNVTITNPWSLYVNTGNSYFGGSATINGSLTLNGKSFTIDGSGNLAFSPTVLYQSGGSAFSLVTNGHYWTFNADASVSMPGNLTVAGLGAFGDGNGTESVRIGNDSSLWDVNIANTMGIKGLADATQGYLTMGSSGQFGWNGSEWTIAGALNATGEFQSTNANSYRIAYGNYGTFWRNDGSTLYLMKTASADSYGSWDGTRPLMVDLASGNVSSSSAWTFNGAVNCTSTLTGLVVQGTNATTTTVANAGNGGNYGIVAHAANANAAVVTFIRDGGFGAYLGFGSDNNDLRVGGWSFGNASYRMVHEGLSNPVFTGDASVSSGNRMIAGAFQSEAGYSVGNPAGTAYRASGAYGGGYGLVDGSYGITMYSTSGALNFGFGSSTSVTSQSQIGTDGTYQVNGSGGIRAGYNSGTASSVDCSGWFRSSGNSGWFNASYGIGVYAIDSTYVRTYNNAQMMAADFVMSSDRRLKTRITDFEYRGRLRPVSYYHLVNEADEFGFISQEVQELYPEIVGADPSNGMLNLSYEKITAILSAQLNRTEDDLATLRQEFNDYRAKQENTFWKRLIKRATKFLNIK